MIPSTFKNWPINGIQALSKLLVELGIHDFHELLLFIRDLPYGRNEKRDDLSLVLKERKGTCSSKHGFIKAVAEENGIEDLSLILGFYQMNLDNTPGIGTGIQLAGLDYLPEAHCYLKMGSDYLDCTSAQSNIEDLRQYILEEQKINTNQLINFKVELHKNYLQNWKEQNNILLRLDEIWDIREQCILNLSNKYLWIKNLCNAPLTYHASAWRKTPVVHLGQSSLRMEK